MLQEADELINLMKTKIDTFVKEKENKSLYNFLGRIENSILNNRDSNFSPSILRTLAIYHSLYQAYVKVLEIARNHPRFLRRKLARTWADSIRVHQHLALGLAVSLGYDTGCGIAPKDLLDFNQIREIGRFLTRHYFAKFSIFFNVNNLLVDCLSQATFVSNETRKKILNELLIAPK